MALSGLLAGTPRWIWAANPGDPAARRLLVIFLRGGADGLGICAPLGNPAILTCDPRWRFRKPPRWIWTDSSDCTRPLKV